MLSAKELRERHEAATPDDNELWHALRTFNFGKTSWLAIESGSLIHRDEVADDPRVMALIEAAVAMLESTGYVSRTSAAIDLIEALKPFKPFNTRRR